ncbi:Cyclic nucleotide-binding domain [Popillia japonica]
MFSTWQMNTILFKLLWYILMSALILHWGLWYILMSALILHWGACAFIVVPQLFNLENNNTQSWIDAMPNKQTTDAIELYKMAAFLAASSFLCTTYIDFQVEHDLDIIISVLMSFTGYIMCIYIFVMMLLMVLSSNTPATKYQSIMSQLSEYMRHRQLPIALQHRLVQYYTHRFRQTYFRESAIMPILSERLQTEINLHCYTTLVESVSILQDLPDDTVSEIVSHLKSEIYLPNDILVKAGSEGDCMYFIASGTVAVSTPTGREVCHLQDGGYFGEVALIRKDHKRIANVVAIEMVEVYKLESKIFKKCLAELPDTYKRLEKISQDRYNRTNFLEELHKKHILEKSLARKHEID